MFNDLSRRYTDDSTNSDWIEFYNELTTPPSQWEGELRDLVIRKKQARKIFVQPNTILVPSVDAGSTPSNNDCDQVHLIDYPTTNIGVIESFLNRNIWWHYVYSPHPLFWFSGYDMCWCGKLLNSQFHQRRRVWGSYQEEVWFVHE